jgi:catechol 2,3-dioxygenase-like lactoylglutathione lyase family enzyme
MDVTVVMASLAVSDLETSLTWYTRIFGRGPDERPMDGLAEWHFAGAGAVQVFQEPERAGASGVTVGVGDLDKYLAQLDAAGIAHDPPTDATFVRLVALADPDRNQVVITTPLSAGKK